MVISYVVDYSVEYRYILPASAYLALPPQIILLELLRVMTRFSTTSPIFLKYVSSNLQHYRSTLDTIDSLHFVSSVF